MFVHKAEAWEAELAREAFGPLVASATFWDSDQGGGEFEMVEGFDDNGNSLGQIDGDDPRWVGTGDLGLGDIPAERGETVKFGLEIW